MAQLMTGLAVAVVAQEHISIVLYTDMDMLLIVKNQGACGILVNYICEECSCGIPYINQ